VNGTIIGPTSAKPIAEFLYAPVLNTRNLLYYSTHLGCQTLKQGVIAEFGVATGWSTHIIRDADKSARMYGFDSFSGLPSDWCMGRDRTWPKGTFTTDGQIPNIEGVTFMKGMFSESIPEFLKQQSENIAFLSIDCDLYDSAKTVLTMLNKRIVPFTVIHFDEICDWGNIDADRYPNWPEGEYKAFVEWIREFNRAAQVIGRNDRYGAAVRVLV
jgi:hypothetical protein